MKTYFAFILIIFLLVCGNPPADTQSKKDSNLFLGLNKEAYLTGRFNANDVLLPVALEENTKDHFLRPDVKVALLKMINAFEESKPSTYKQQIFLVSSFRNFNQQKGIWESKYTGKKVMREPIADKSPEQIVSLILEFSSAPGTSRHHWGTDFDLNALDNAYFQSNGKGKILYEWLKANAGQYGFCQPYNELAKRGGKGYQEEKWHWSYAPISQALQNEWINLYKTNKIQLKGSFIGADVLGESALTYVSSINSDCNTIANQR
ncbi:MAG: M15 family metallopeptidase [Leptospira sp.]|nr:M15 family metallopeptidase [Leptospira sp.]